MVDNKDDLVHLAFDDVVVLKKLYDEARRDKRKEFVFQGRAILTAYAKYMLKYLMTCTHFKEFEKRRN